MASNDLNEKRFETDIESFFISPEGGYKKGCDVYDPKLGLYRNTLLNFVKETQPKEWQRFANQNKQYTEEKFFNAFVSACETEEGGLIHVLRHGFKHRGREFNVCYFKPESSLNETATNKYEKNIVECYRQWHYSATETSNSVDMVLVLNGIPVFAFELKNQFTNQNITNAEDQWRKDRSKNEICFKFNRRILAFFCIDLTQASMTTKLNGKDTKFLPFNQGSHGAGHDGGKGNPANPNGYVTSYIWEKVFQKDSMMDIIQKFIHLQIKEEKTISKNGDEIVNKKKALIFPRYHQLDVVRKLVADVKENGSGKNYLIQHSAGSGKSNSIAWTVYRLGSLYNALNEPIFSSVIVVTDRTVLDTQLQDTISSFDHTLGSVEAIDDKKRSKGLKDAINNGARIIITTLQKFPVIYEEINNVKGKNFAIVVDEAHSSQTGTSALKLKSALANTEDALREFADIEEKAEEELDPQDRLIKELTSHGRHSNLSFFAFTATPKSSTLELFGTEQSDGSFHPFHIYSMRQAIEEGFILDVLQNYMTYNLCYKIIKSLPENPDVHASRAAKVIKKYTDLHPTNISQKAEIIVETFREKTSKKINSKAKMMVVTSSRLAAVRYYHEVKRYIEANHYDNIDVLAAFSGSIKDNGVEYTESSINVRKDGSNISENQTKAEFHDNFNILIVAEKYQTGFDEPLLHTMIIDKKLKGVKAVQTLSRVNRTTDGKDDTFILDFVNTKEDIIKAFQPFYQETFLTQEFNVELIYKVQTEIRGFNIYGQNDVDNFCKEFYDKKNDKKPSECLASLLTSAIQKYREKSQDDQYKIRRQVRCFNKWYSYITQIVRMFDVELHKEYKFLSFLIKFLDLPNIENIDIEKYLQLEYYQLKKSFEGAVELEKKNLPYEPTTQKAALGMEKKSPLDQIIASINERYKGVFTDADKVIFGDIKDRLLDNPDLLMDAKNSNKLMFKESLFDQYFAKALDKSYQENKEAYKALFDDNTKYKVFKDALAEIVYNAAKLTK